MKSERIDLHLITREVSNEVGLEESTIFRILADSYSQVFKTEVKAIPLVEDEEIKYILVDQTKSRILNNMKLTRPKLDKITGIFKTKCTEIRNSLDIAERMKTLKKIGMFIPAKFESRFGEHNLYFIKDVGVFAKIHVSEMDILAVPAETKGVVLVRLLSINVNQKTGKVDTIFVFKDKQNISNMLMPYLNGISYTVADFIGNKIKVRLKKRLDPKTIKAIIEQSGLRIQFVWPKTEKRY